MSTMRTKDISSIVRTADGKEYFVSTYCEYEKPEGEIITFVDEIDIDMTDPRLQLRYKTNEEAIKYHDDICTHLEGYLDGSYPPED